MARDWFDFREEVPASSPVHLSDVANLLEAALPINESHGILRDLLYATTMVIFEPTKRHYLDAIQVAEEASVGLNDALAYALMKAAANEAGMTFAIL